MAPWRAGCLALGLATLAGLPPAAEARAAAQPWAAAAVPAAGAPRIVGAHGLGCIAGAVALPPEGPGWQVIRLSRNRFWGHPALVAYLRDLAGRAGAARLPSLWIGDLGQPRGGPLPWGHASHQIGLDADVWLDLSPKPTLSRAAREHVEVASLVQPDGMAVDPIRFTPAHAALLRLAAEPPEVERIFVNPAIKQALCVAEPQAAWLRKLRPWRGHDSHMHVRLRCRDDQPDCRDQAPVPPGSGCDASLTWWFSAEARQPPRSRTPAAPQPSLPAACAGILGAP